MTIVYCTSNGYGNIDTDSEAFQLGMKLFEAEKLLTDVEHLGKPLDEVKAREIVYWFCNLAAEVGQLRADYDMLRRCLDGTGRYRFVDDGPCKIQSGFLDTE